MSSSWASQKVTDMPKCDYCGHPVYPPDEGGQDNHVMCVRTHYMYATLGGYSPDCGKS